MKAGSRRLCATGLLILLSAPAIAEEGGACSEENPLASLDQSAQARLAIVHQTGRAPACVPVPASWRREIRVDRDGKWLPYMVDVTESFSISSIPDERWIWSLADAAIRGTPFTHVITFIDTDKSHRWIVEREARWVRAAGMIPVSIPTPDEDAPLAENEEEWVRRFLITVTTPGARVLAHCNAGQGRTHMFKALFRIAVQGWSIADAKAEAAENGSVQPDKDFQAQLDFIERMGRMIQDPQNPLGLSPELLSRLCIAYADGGSGL